MCETKKKNIDKKINAALYFFYNTVHPRLSGPRLTGRVQQVDTFNYLV